MSPPPPRRSTPTAPRIGTDVTNEYVRDIPLYNRSFFGLVFLAGGVTETSGSGTKTPIPPAPTSSPTASATPPRKSASTAARSPRPEQGEGGNTNVYYQPSVEIVQEFKVQNNSFSAEYGNNGGTVVNIVLKQGTNKFHGSGWWYGQRSAFDANDFFNTGRQARSRARPIRLLRRRPDIKNKTLLLRGFRKSAPADPVNLEGSFPPTSSAPATFRRASQLPTATPDRTRHLRSLRGNHGPAPVTRTQFSDDDILNKIRARSIPSGRHSSTSIPHANIARRGLPRSQLPQSDAFPPGWQFDVKLDHQIQRQTRVSGRYSQHHDEFNVPSSSGDGDFGDGDGSLPPTVQNASLEYNWAIKPTALWTSRFSVDRVNAPGHSTTFPTLERCWSARRS